MADSADGAGVLPSEATTTTTTTTTDTVQPTRRLIVGVSTKMYFSLDRTSDYVDVLLVQLTADEAAWRGVSDTASLLDRADIFVCPDFVALSAVATQLRCEPLEPSPESSESSSLPSSPPSLWSVAGAPRVLLGAQDCGWTAYGAFTGTVSPAVLADVGVRIVEIGHAERRRLLAETDNTTAAKAAAAVSHGLVPLVCVGETTAPGKKADANDASASAFAAAAVVIDQLAPVLAAVPDAAEMLVAYEPVWAIGAAQPAVAAHVRAVVAHVRTHSPAICRRGAARTRILYGGSAGPGLFARLRGAVDGLFLGRFGHDPDRFLFTAREVANAAASS